VLRSPRRTGVTAVSVDEGRAPGWRTTRAIATEERMTDGAEIQLRMALVSNKRFLGSSTKSPFTLVYLDSPTHCGALNFAYTNYLYSESVGNVAWASTGSHSYELRESDEGILVVTFRQL
jgi:hypothetical protein